MFLKQYFLVLRLAQEIETHPHPPVRTQAHIPTFFTHTHVLFLIYYFQIQYLDSEVIERIYANIYQSENRCTHLYYQVYLNQIRLSK